MHPTAQQHLANLLEAARLSRVLNVAIESDPTATAQSTLIAFKGALDALRATDFISDEEHRDWYLRMFEAFNVEVPDSLRSVEPNTTVLVGHATDGVKQLPAPRPAGTLLRAFAAPGVSWEYGGGRFQIISVEVYENRVTINWREHPLADPALTHPTELHAAERDFAGLAEPERTKQLQRVRTRLAMTAPRVLALRDDVGTQYSPQGGDSGGDDHERRGSQSYAPAPPATATCLIIAWLNHEIDVPLPTEPYLQG